MKKMNNFLDENQLCKDIKTLKVKIIKEIGKGSYGRIFLVKKKNKEMILKWGNIVSDYQVIKEDINSKYDNYLSLFNDIIKKNKDLVLNLEYLMEANNAQNINDHPGEKIYVPKLFNYSHYKSYISNVSEKKKIKIPEGSLITNSENLSDYNMLSFLSQFKKKYFVDVYDMTVCKIPKLNFGILMEKMEGNLSEIINNIPDENKLLNDVLEGLKFLDSHKIAHNDLHTKNILYDSKFNYKITDFGVSVKYSPPMIGSSSVLDDEFDIKLPNIYMKSYDISFFLYSVCEYSYQAKNILKYYLGNNYDDYFDNVTFRPKIKKWFELEIRFDQFFSS